MDDLAQLDLLPPVSNISSMTLSQYRFFAQGVIDHKDNCLAAELMDLTKFVDWCNLLDCFNICRIPPHPSEMQTSVSTSMTTPSLHQAVEIVLPQSTFSFSALLVNATRTGICYDDYNCDNITEHAYLLHSVLGIAFLFVCSACLLSNAACLVAFNKSSNRTGATLYFSVITIVDCVYLLVVMLLNLPRYLYSTSEGQVRAYAENTAWFVPAAFPFLTFSELASVWLTLCVLIDRYLYLRLGFFSRAVTSRVLHLRITILVLVLTFCYSIPKFFEFHVEVQGKDTGLYKAVFTDLGKSKIFRNLMDHLLSVPIEMFLPYLAVSIVTCLEVSKMVDFGSSKWKAVASLWSPSNFGCCRCGDDFADCNFFRTQTLSASSVTSRNVAELVKGADEKKEPFSVMSIGAMTFSSEKVVDDWTDGAIVYCGIPFEKRNSLMPLYFLVPPPRTETQETANVVIAVCLGFLVIITKIPRLILHVLASEEYMVFDATLLRIVSGSLCLAFIALKPFIYLVLGVHFRHALTGLCCCACLYTPVMMAPNGRFDINGTGGTDGLINSLCTMPQIIATKDTTSTLAIITETPILAKEMHADGEKPNSTAYFKLDKPVDDEKINRCATISNDKALGQTDQLEMVSLARESIEAEQKIPLASMEEDTISNP